VEAIGEEHVPFTSSQGTRRSTTRVEKQYLTALQLEASDRNWAHDTGLIRGRRSSEGCYVHVTCERAGNFD
jgi:hypothetical protein